MKNCILKITLFPVSILLSGLQIVIAVILGISSWLFHLVASAVFILAIIAAFLGATSGPEIKEMLLISMCIFAVPIVGMKLLSAITFIKSKIDMYIHSQV